MTDLAIDNAGSLVFQTGAKPAAIGITGQQQGIPGGNLLLEILDNPL